MTISNTVTKEDLKNILESIAFSIFQYGRGEIGEIKMYGGETPPSGWLKCDGSAVSRTTYADLFAVIGTSFGNGDGSTTFNLPDFDGSMPVGAWYSADRYDIGETGGERSHTLTVDEMPSHGHALKFMGYGSDNYNLVFQYGVNSNTGHYNSNGTYLGNTGGSQAHNNMPPFVGVNFIIYAKHEKSVVTPKTNIHISTSDPTSADGLNGDIWVTYEVSS